MRTVLRLLAGRRDLRLVLLAGLISQTGDWILTVGMLYRVYAMTGSTIMSALAYAASFAPQILAGSVAGVFADRWDRKRMMVTANLLQAAGLLPLLTVHDAGRVWIVFAVLFWEGTVQQFFIPAEQATVPRLVDRDQLLAANALSGQVTSVSRLAGAGLGGVIAAVGGIAAVTFADTASFAASAGLLSLMSATGRMATIAGKGRGAARRLGRLGEELRDGLRVAAGDRVLRGLLVFVLVTSAGQGVFGTLFAPFVERVLHGSSTEYGLVMGAQAIGGILGGLVATAMSSRVSAPRLATFGAIGFGVVDLAVFLYPLGYLAVWPAVAGMIIVGIPGALEVAGLITLFQQHTRDAYRGRIFGALNAVEGVMVLTGTLSAGFLARPLGIVPVLAVQGAAGVLAGAGLLMWLGTSGETSAPTGNHDVEEESPSVMRADKLEA
jgi:Na+/melibiose symporter-like transporter